MSRLLAAEQRLAWAQAMACKQLRELKPLQVQDGMLMYQQLFGQATADQFDTLRQMRKRREAAPYAPTTLTAAEKKALRSALTRDEIVAQQVVPERDAFLRFRDEHWTSSGDEELPQSWPARIYTPFRSNRYGIELARRLQSAGARPGYVSCSLMWDSEDPPVQRGQPRQPGTDASEGMGLCCTAPGGQQISRDSTSTPKRSGDGLLDVSETGGDHPVEHIIFPHRPLRAGKYKFWVAGPAGDTEGSASAKGRGRCVYTVRMVCGAHVALRRMRARGKAHPCLEFEVSRSGEVVVESIVVPSDGATDARAFRSQRLWHLNMDQTATTAEADGPYTSPGEARQYLCPHAAQTIGPHHVLSQHFYTHSINPNLNWHVHEEAPGGELGPAQPASAGAGSGVDVDTQRKELLKRKAERDQLEFQRINQAIDWFEDQLQRGEEDGQDIATVASAETLDGTVKTAAAVWGVDDPERNEKLRRGLDNVMQRLPKHLAEKRAAAKETAAAAALAANVAEPEPEPEPEQHIPTAATSEAHETLPLSGEGDEEDGIASPPLSPPPPPQQQQQQQSSEASSLHWREERFAAIERRLSSMRAASRIDLTVTRRQADMQLQQRIKQLDADTSLVEEWEYRYKRRVAWSRIEARRRQFEAGYVC